MYQDQIVQSNYRQNGLQSLYTAKVKRYYLITLRSVHNFITLKAVLVHFKIQMKFVKTSTAFSPNNVHCLSQHSKLATHVESKVNLSREWGWGDIDCDGSIYCVNYKSNTKPCHRYCKEDYSQSCNDRSSVIEMSNILPNIRLLFPPYRSPVHGFSPIPSPHLLSSLRPQGSSSTRTPTHPNLLLNPTWSNLHMGRGLRSHNSNDMINLHWMFGLK